MVLEDFLVNDVNADKATKGDSCTMKVPFRIRLSDKMYKIVEN
jgi:putative protease